MKNRIVGILIVGFAVLIGFVVYMFNRALTNIVSASCLHGPACPMYETIDFQTKIGIGIIIFVIVIGLYLILFGKEEKIITKIKKIKQEIPQVEAKKITKENYNNIIKTLSADEKNIFESVIEAQGTIFQSELVEKSRFDKVKVTRILDRLEGKSLIERKRRGMTNVVVLKS